MRTDTLVTVGIICMCGVSALGQSPGQGRGGGRGAGGEPTLVIDQAPTDRSVPISKEQLDQYLKDMDAKKLATLRLLEGGKYNVNIRRITAAETALVHPKTIDKDVAAIFDPFGNAVHTALSFPVLGEDVLVTGAGPIGIMAAAVARHAGARFVVITDVNPFRLELARKMGVTVAVNPQEKSIQEVQKELGMQEGFDVGLEMSGNARAFRDMLANMAHGGKIAMLGIPAEEMAIDWNTVIFSMLTIKGIYGREMYETWYKMTVMLESGLDIRPVITHRFPYQDFEKGFDVMRSGCSGKVILEWS